MENQKNIKTILTSILYSLFGFTFSLHGASQNSDYFQISIPSIDAPFASVNARMMVFGGKIVTGGGGSYDWKRGWADFITELNAKTVGGEELSVAQKGEGIDSYWLLSINERPYNGEITLSYNVDLNYTRKNWSFGNEQAGKIYNGGLYSVTKPFFMNSDDKRSAEISIDVPADWQISVPWTAINEQKNLFFVENWQALEKNAFAVGRFNKATMNADSFDLEIILLGDFEGASPLVGQVIKKIVPIYLSIFPDTPKTKYTMFFLRGDVEDAEAFNNGAAFTTNLKLSQENTIFWADFIAHELFHFWNGQRIRPADRGQGSWFSEGLTDYYANLTLVNRRILSEEWFVRRMENIFGNYLWFETSDIFNGLSVLDAGKEKGRNRFGVYDAGWVIAFALDTEIRRKTNNKKSLDDAMTALYRRYGKTGERYQLDDLINIMSESTGVDLSLFFEKYLKSRSALPLVEMMGSYGFIGYSNPYANEFYLSKKTDSISSENENWINLIKNRFSN
ncbi:MAG: hypothetical protein H6912_02200 [Kordiimonadaceae bacterium]|nr:hypothetical protein [Kordiimonadaceae bacterium]